MTTATRYIQRKEGRTVETVDQFPYATKEDRQEARRVVAEYNLSDRTAHHYLSRRACKGWNDETSNA
jgi:hypothetical protein